MKLLALWYDVIDSSPVAWISDAWDALVWGLRVAWGEVSKVPGEVRRRWRMLRRLRALMNGRDV